MSAGPRPVSTGRKKSRCRTVWVNTNIAYRAADATAANVSCDAENSGPGSEVVNRGSTSVRPASVITVARAEPVPSALNSARWCLSAPISSDRPTIPLTVIISAAKTVSLARVEVSLSPDTIKVTISATSMTVTATASTNEPNGSPTRCATTSAWWTAASTAPTRNTAITAAATDPGCRPHESASTSTPTAGAHQVQRKRPWVAALMPEPYGTAETPRASTRTGARSASGPVLRSPSTTSTSAARPARSEPVTSASPHACAASEVAVASASAIG